MKAEKLPVVPNPIGVLSRKGRNEEINIQNFSIGNMQAQALGEAIKNTVAKKLQLASNRLSTVGALSIIQNINPSVQEINLSNNTIQDKEQARQIKM